MKPQIALTGNEALALGMRQINPDVVAAYPITPQTEVVQMFSQFVADGEVDTEFITVESEHSAMSATVGAAAGGCRAMTATSANGLALMWEIVYIAASLRLPIVMPLINRALSAPINIHCDHSDAMGVRDSGWIQLFGENAQQAYDNLIQAVRIAEHKNVRLPVIVNMDGFIISHAVENLKPLTDQEVTDFIGDYKPEYSLLDPGNPITVGPLDLQDYYFEHKRQQIDGMEHVFDVVAEVAREFKELTGREYGFFETYKMDDAEIAVLGLGSTMGTARIAVDNLRADGIKAGLINLRLFRPFPAGQLIRALNGVKVLGVFDRADTFSLNGGPLFLDVKASLYDSSRDLKVVNYIYGLGGRDINVSNIEDILRELVAIKEGQKEKKVTYYGVRE
ncbi:2-ketoisovalerate ferredoxin oxidoreductase subunit alpha [Halothermothrix orenii]|uniref:Pyruvate ferredoxin oxidoreductase, alpha subunit n=1 Tax=Halothermothrix orenii (strain H 168 / OCM 544 / DSM 9562) TaxID=373903 RepID=B8CZW5_HALOH|nr:2-ketoisovalerate ferredoxin oxidoreductase subunit alpha [Halothermothrix orenii]ACL70817.1 pyruvate ferredoxin oxidoreductase, alpha subunit [Halothermothrix orenii H 168]